MATNLTDSQDKLYMYCPACHALKENLEELTYANELDAVYSWFCDVCEGQWSFEMLVAYWQGQEAWDLLHWVTSQTGKLVVGKPGTGSLKNTRFCCWIPEDPKAKHACATTAIKVLRCAKEDD